MKRPPSNCRPRHSKLVHLPLAAAIHFAVIGEHFGRRPLGDLGAAVHDDAAVAQAADRVHDVLDDDDGAALGAQLLDERNADLELGRIEAGEPFVEQKDFRL